MKRLIVLVACVLVFAAAAAAQDPEPALVIKEDTTWTGEVTVDRTVRIEKGTLTVAPGTTVKFAKNGSITVEAEGALAASGAEGKPVQFTGEKTGLIRGNNGKIILERCVMTGLGDQTWLTATAGKEGVTLRDCEITDCGRTIIRLGRWNRCEVSRCRVRQCRGGILATGVGWVTISDNVVSGVDINVSGALTRISGNVVIRGSIVGDHTDQFIVEGNYVHQPEAKGTYCMRNSVGVIRDNVFRGASWLAARVGGEFTGNVFISAPHEEVLKAKQSFDKNCTHAQICFLTAESRVSRNIFIGGVHGSIVGVGSRTLSDGVFRNNTFDIRGRGNAFWLNHLMRLKPTNINIRGNIFMRSDGMWDSHGKDGAPDSVAYVDYNLWAGPEKGGRLKREGRYHSIHMTGRKTGDEGFGAHDVPAYADRAKILQPEDVVVNPNVTFPFADEDMTSGKHTAREVLAHYRKAYTPKPGSPAINAGDPVDKDDPAVKDGKPDAGAVEK